MHIRIGDIELAEVSLYPSAEGAKEDRLLAEKVREEAARMSRPGARNAVERDCARRCRGLVGDLVGGTCGPCDGIDCECCDVPDCDLLYECGETCLGGGYGLGTLCPGPIVAAGLRGAAAAWRGQALRARQRETAASSSATWPLRWASMPATCPAPTSWTSSPTAWTAAVADRSLRACGLAAPSGPDIWGLAWIFGWEELI